MGFKRAMFVIIRNRAERKQNIVSILIDYASVESSLNLAISKIDTSYFFVVLAVIIFFQNLSNFHKESTVPCTDVLCHINAW